MEHSLYAYLQRQSSETLNQLLDTYKEQSVTELVAEIITLIEEILCQRKALS